MKSIKEAWEQFHKDLCPELVPGTDVYTKVRDTFYTGACSVIKISCYPLAFPEVKRQREKLLQEFEEYKKEVQDRLNEQPPF